MKKKGSKLADRIMQEKRRQKYFEGLVKRKKQVGDKNGRTTK